MTRLVRVDHDVWANPEHVSAIVRERVDTIHHQGDWAHVLLTSGKSITVQDTPTRVAELLAGDGS